MTLKGQYEDTLRAAFQAGFEISREGKNGECYFKYRRTGIGNEIEIFPYDEYMDKKFLEWAQANDI